MEFGVFLPVSGRASSRGGLIDAVKKAELFGFTSVWAADRIVIPWKIETPYAYNWSGQFFVPPEKPFLEPLSVLAFLAGCTERIKLGVSVLVLPYRNPVYWAKLASTIDQLSEGRLIVGVGAGWMREEFEALGADFEHRGAVTDEQLELIKVLWSDEHSSFQGKFYGVKDIAFQPKAFGDRIPIWVGGESRLARRRAGRHGNAWFPYYARVTPQELSAGFAEVRQFAEEAHRDPNDVRLHCCLPIEITAEPIPQEADRVRGSTEQVTEALAQYGAAGVGTVALQFLVGRYPERLEQMQRFHEQVLPNLRATTPR